MSAPNELTQMDNWDTAYFFIALPLAYTYGGMSWLFLAGLGFFVQSFLRKIPLFPEVSPVIEGVFASFEEKFQTPHSQEPIATPPQLPARITETLTPEVHTWTRDAERSL